MNILLLYFDISPHFIKLTNKEIYYNYEYNSGTKNLSRFIENICAPLTENMRYRIRDTSHLLDIIDTINETGIPEEIIIVPLDIVNMFLSIDNVKGMNAARLALNTRDSNKPSTECVLDGLEICLYNDNSIFDKNNL